MPADGAGTSQPPAAGSRIFVLGVGPGGMWPVLGNIGLTGGCLKRGESGNLELERLGFLRLEAVESWAYD